MEKKKRKKLIIIFSIVVGLLLVGFGSYFVIDKYFSKDDVVDKNDANQSSDETNVGNNDNDEVTEDENEFDSTHVVKDETDDEFINSLYRQIRTENKEYGFYFDKDVTVESISTDYLLPYLLNDYADQEEYDWSGNVQLILLGEEAGAPISEIDKIERVSKKQLEQYFKEKYNFEKVFDFSSIDKDSLYYYDKNYLTFNFNNCRTAVYSMNDEMFYFGRVGRTCGNAEIYNEFISYEMINNEVYIYDTMTYCYNETGIFSCHYSVFGNSIYNYNYDYVKNLDDIMQYVFDNYGDKLNKYKHTFKLGSDGEYYWYSTEIVND